MKVLFKYCRVTETSRLNLFTISNKESVDGLAMMAHGGARFWIEVQVSDEYV